MRRVADVDKFVGVMGVDPGLKTGCSLGVYPADSGWLVAERIEYALARGWVASFEVVLDREDGRAAELNAAEVIAREWTSFAFTCAVPSGADWVQNPVAPSGESVSRSAGDTWQPCEAVMVVEEWTPRLPLASAERDAMYPIRIAASLEGLLYRRVSAAPVVVSSGTATQGQRLVYQSPSYAKRFATDARLRDWGLWVVGSDHERDAHRHVASWLAGL